METDRLIMRATYTLHTYPRCLYGMNSVCQTVNYSKELRNDCREKKGDRDKERERERGGEGEGERKKERERGLGFEVEIRSFI